MYYWFYNRNDAYNTAEAEQLQKTVEKIDQVLDRPKGIR